MFRMIFDIAKSELQMLFYSPVAWLILVVFGVQTGMYFSNLLESMVSSQEMGYALQNCTIYLFGGMRGLFTNMQGYLYFYIPLLTMGLVSREFSSGSIRLLYSSPITNFQIIMGKFVSMMFYGLFMVGILLILVICGWVFVKDFDLPMVLTGLLGLYLLICAYASIGIFMSSLTSYQIVAAIGTFAILMVLSMIGGWWQNYDFVRDITYWLSMPGRCDQFIDGMICSEDLLYFILVIGLFLALTIIRLNAVRQNVRFAVTFGKNVCVIVLVCLLGYFSSLPTMKVYYDTTATKMNTLTQNSQDIIAKLDGGVTITSYINLFDPMIGMYGSPYFLKSDMERFERYLRFKPDMKLKYVYYYDETPVQSPDRRLIGLSPHDKMVEICKIYGLDSAKFMTPEEIRNTINLSGEKNMFVRQIVRENGEKTWLRVFNDSQRYPSEREISAAFKRLVMKLPVVGFVQGHGERSHYGVPDRDYGQFANEKSFRYALTNQGFDVEGVNLGQPVPENIKIIVISDMREYFTPEEEANLEQYIDRGGDMFILGEPRRRDVMNGLFAKFGFEMTEGVLVKGNTNLQADVILSYPTPESEEISYEFGYLIKRNIVVTTPSASGLVQVADKGYKVTDLFRTATSGVWNEVETVDFVDDTVRLNPTIGEVEKTYTTIVALSRQVNGKEQKIILTGDADCISNGEFGRRVTDIQTANYSMITGGFYWLSDYEVPIDVRRPPVEDTKIYLSKLGSDVVKWSFMLVFPLLMAIAGVIVWIRRKGR